MPSLRRVALILLVPAVLAASAVGCSAGPATTTVDATAEATTIAVGDTLVVDLGTVSSSIGDSWDVAVEPDPTVLGPGQATSTAQDDDDGTGGYSTLTYAFEAVAPGRTTIECQYSFRGSTDDDDVRGKVERTRTRLTVTVE